MAESQANGTVIHLESKQIGEVAQTFKKAIETYKEQKSLIRDTTAELLGSWYGDARNEFEADYNLFYDKLGDLEDILISYYNNLLDAQTSYEEADEQVGKAFKQEG
ncbi:WXG100 family type VII secretion target [Roseburia inulinivorans]